MLPEHKCLSVVSGSVRKVSGPEQVFKSTVLERVSGREERSKWENRIGKDSLHHRICLFTAVSKHTA